VPILEAESELVFNQDFFCGYSPERINPGDNTNKLTTIVKVTSGSTPEAASWIDNLYGSIIKAGTHKSPSLKVAEAAKVIENTQRDLNIALVNELSIIFRLLNIDTLDVLEAAGTKWNFLPFRPGLVGGHCIGVDPYYLTYKSEQEGYMPQVVLAGRRINDGMGKWIAQQLVLKLCRRQQSVSGTRVLILGFAFKEDCPDFRNTKVLDLITTLESYGLDIDVIDPYVDKTNVEIEYNIKVSSVISNHSKYGAVIAAVAHTEFKTLTVDEWLSFLEPAGILMDLKGIIPRQLKPIRI
jgi:UDP-N-acetyl-D-galactosamine dehydrogenase